MDQVALVESQIDDGRKLVEHLGRSGFPVTAAFWLNASEASRWYLYLASPVVDEEGRRKTYGRVFAALSKMPEPVWIDPCEIKVLKTTDPMAQDVLAAQRLHSGKRPIRYSGKRLGPVSVEAAYIYPPEVAVAVDEHGNGRG
jgi:hypothetical protein